MSAQGETQETGCTRLLALGAQASQLIPLLANEVKGRLDTRFPRGALNATASNALQRQQDTRLRRRHGGGRGGGLVNGGCPACFYTQPVCAAATVSINFACKHA